MHGRRRVGVFTDYIGAYGRRVLQGVARFAHAHADWSLTTLRMWSFTPRQDLSRFVIDGMITTVLPRQLEKRVRSGKLATVNVSSNLLKTGLPSVLVDHQLVGQMAAEFFLGRGFRNYAYCGSHEAKYSHLRGAAFAARLAADGFRCTAVHGLGDGLRRMLAREPKPLAILANNDVTAADVLGACLELGIPVPESIAVLGVDDDDLVVSIARPALASIEIPARQLGYEAAALLERLMNGGEPPAAPILLAPSGVIVRASADIFAVDDPDVAEALRFIRENAAAPIRVHDVLGHVALSRRTLERRFVKQLGRTPLAEIHRVHLDRAKRLLIDTDLAIPAVAEAAGFGDDTRFNFMFRRDAGVPPTAYRRKFRLSDRPANKV